MSATKKATVAVKPCLVTDSKRVKAVTAKKTDADTKKENGATEKTAKKTDTDTKVAKKTDEDPKQEENGNRIDGEVVMPATPAPPPLKSAIQYIQTNMQHMNLNVQKQILTRVMMATSDEDKKNVVLPKDKTQKVPGVYISTNLCSPDLIFQIYNIVSARIAVLNTVATSN
jgi:hypothetical protein